MTEGCIDMLNKTDKEKTEDPSEKLPFYNMAIHGPFPFEIRAGDPTASLILYIIAGTK
jgi:hypothetical protein